MFKNQEKISGHQALMLILAGGVGLIFAVMVVPAIKEAGPDGWLTVIIGYGLAMIVGLILVKLSSRFPNQSFFQYLPVVLGKPLGKLAGLVFILTFWIMSGVALREFTELIRFFLPNTPSLVIAMMFILLIMYAMKKGFETSARTVELFVVIDIILIGFLLLLTLPNTDWKNLTPMLAKGIFPVLKNVPLQMSYGLEPLLFMSLWLPFLNKSKDGYRAVLIGFPIAGAIGALFVAVAIAFTGVNLSPRIVYPVYYMSNYIRIANFLQGFEAIFLLLWLVGSYLEMVVFFYIPTMGLAQLVNLKDYQPLVLPILVSFLFIAMIPSSLLDAIKWDAFISTYIKLPVGLLIPVVWVIALIRGLGKKSNPAT